MSHEDEKSFEMTLDPPGKIAVVGAGTLGIEAALYGRFLGYEVSVFEQGEIGEAWRDMLDQPLPVLPARCLSPLAFSALNAQESRSGRIATLPTTVRDWIHDGLSKLSHSDLLRDRVFCGCRVDAIEAVAVADGDGDGDGELDDEFFVDGDVPPDFCLTIFEGEQMRHEEFEAVIVAVGSCDTVRINGLLSLWDSPYLFRITTGSSGTVEESLRDGWRAIVSVYARLGGRRDLDLYRPRRS